MERKTEEESERSRVTATYRNVLTIFICYFFCLVFSTLFFDSFSFSFPLFSYAGSDRSSGPHFQDHSQCGSSRWHQSTNR